VGDGKVEKKIGRRRWRSGRGKAEAGKVRRK